MKSDKSMEPPLKFNEGAYPTEPSLIQGKRSDSPEPSCVSMKSDKSMEPPLKFNEGAYPTEPSLIQGKRSDSPEPSCVSMKSDKSMEPPLKFNEGEYPTEASIQNIQKGKSEVLDTIFRELEHKVISLVKKELKRFKKLLSPDYPVCSEREVENEEDQISVREGALKITLHVLRNMNQTDLANTLQTKAVYVYQQKVKHRLIEKFKRISSQHGISYLLSEIYTELYITEGGSGEVNYEHEVRQIETASRRLSTEEKPIKCNDLFKGKLIRSVLTKGVAGIGKTVSVQKFILDWAEGRENQDVTFIFPLPFRELNLMKEKKFSLMDLLHDFFPETKHLQLIDCKVYKVIFIFDGLDEYRLPLDFQNNESLWDVTEPSTVDVLMTNLIKGNLLPSALLWITSRPAAASQIPPECVDQVTEVRGFSDPQKDEYFRKRISDQSLANNIISHIKLSRSLYIMCHLPVFCWIAATVLKRLLGEAKSKEIPKTLTQMFTHFMIFQIKHKDRKYHGKTDTDPHLTEQTILALGKLAFQQLEKGNLIFYEQDLRECGIDVKEVSVYSGVCTQIFREELSLYHGKVFIFVHLSVQEFLAALYAFLSFMFSNTNVLDQQSSKSWQSWFDYFFRRSTMSAFLMNAVDKALQSENGHLDLFLRFLLGLSVESNQTALQDLLRQTGSCSHSKEETVKYIKEKIRKNPSPEKSINLFHCLNELNDDSLVNEIQTYLSRRGNCHLYSSSLSPAQWSALVFVLLNSEKELDEFDLSKYDRSEECLLRLLPVVKSSRKAVLSDCSITEKGCAALAVALRSNPPSHLKELNLSINKLEDSGVKHLCALLEDPHCKLEKLQVPNCSIGEEGCAALARALRLNPSSHLRELKLNHNKPGDLGVKQLSALLEDSHCSLEKLQLPGCDITEEGCAALASALRSNPSSHMRELHLTYNNPGDSGVKEISALLRNPHCKLQKLLLAGCSITKEHCAPLASGLRSNPSSHLRELDLNYNNLRDLGAKQLSALLKNQHCTLETLQLSDCKIGGKGCAALASALRSNRSSHLKELNLNSNEPGDSGVKELSALLRDPHCTLEKLELSSCSIPEEDCADLASALMSNPSSHLRELNLNHNELGHLGVNKLSALLKDSHCTLEKLQLSKCSITEEGCTALASALMSNSSSRLKELYLDYNKLGDSGVKQLSALLENPDCTLVKLLLCDCSLSVKSCTVLASALSSNSSSLRELNLSGNKLQDPGAKMLSAGLGNPQCKLESLGLSNCSITEEGCSALASALSSNPSSHLRELNLNYNEPGDSGVKQLSALLENPHCKLEKLVLRIY